LTSFFFAPDSPRLTALIRIALGLTLFCEGLSHWRYAVELYSTAGPAMPIFVRQVDGAPRDVPPERKHLRLTATRVESLVPLPIPRPTVAVMAHTALILAAFSVVLGWHTHTSLIVLLLLAAWLWPLDLPGTFGKQSVIALHLVLLLACSRCGAVWSIDSLMDDSRLIRCPLSIMAPRRLMQVLVCCVYLGAAITKLKTPSFASGDLLEFSLLDDHWGSGRLGLWLTTLPHMSLIFSQLTIFFEILFPFLVWIPRLRLPLLAIAFAFHTAMGCLLSVGIFPAVMFTALLSFLEERDLQVLQRLCARRDSDGQRKSEFWRIQLPSLLRGTRSKTRQVVVHLTIVAVLVGCGLFVQMRYDWYGVFGRRPAPVLAEVSADDVAEMLAERLPPYEEYFHRIELGSRFGGNQMFGASRRFKVGQRVYVLAQLIQPHPAFNLEGLLLAPDGREAGRFTHRVAPGIGYTVNGFELTSGLPAGTYRIVLQADGFAIAERRFEVDP